MRNEQWSTNTKAVFFRSENWEEQKKDKITSSSYSTKHELNKIPASSPSTAKSPPSAPMMQGELLYYLFDKSTYTLVFCVHVGLCADMTNLSLIMFSSVMVLRHQIFAIAGDFKAAFTSLICFDHLARRCGSSFVQFLDNKCPLQPHVFSSFG